MPASEMGLDLSKQANMISKVDLDNEIPGASETRKSLRAIHDNIAIFVSGEGSEDSPYDTSSSDGGEHGYLGVYAVVESVDSGDPVYLKFQGVTMKVNNTKITFVSGEPSVPSDPEATVEQVIDTLNGPLNHFIEQTKN